jgi:hypothetical protein
MVWHDIASSELLYKKSDRVDLGKASCKALQKVIIEVRLPLSIKQLHVFENGWNII